MEKGPNKLEKLEESLYSKGWEDKSVSYNNYYKPENKDDHLVKEGWSSYDLEKQNTKETKKAKRSFGSGLLSNMSFLRQLLLASILFFVFSALVAMYVFLAGGNVISSSNIDIKINAPLSLSGGEKIPIQISVQNQNNTPLSFTDLVIEYDSGARDALDLNRELKRYIETIGNMAVGEKITKQFDVVFFGEEGSKKNINVSLVYRVSGSNAILSKDISHEFIITSSPVSVKIDGPSEIGQNNMADFSIKIKSNSESIIKNFSIKAEYPFGFSLSNMSSRPSLGNNVWSLGDIRPGAERTINIRGTFGGGGEGETRAIKIIAGIADTKDEKNIAVPFLEKEMVVAISRPLVDAKILFNGSDTDEYITKAGQGVSVGVSWANNLNTTAENMIIEATIKGEIFDRYSVRANDGFFRSLENKVVWDQTTNSQFASVAPGERGVVNFSFDIVDDVSKVAKPEMEVEVRVRASGSGGLGGEIASSVSKKIKISSVFGLSGATLFADGPIQNTGPIPPQAEKETTYTIRLSLSSSLNNMGGASVRMTLPTYVRWVNSFSPSSEKFSYNMLTGELIWQAGEIKGGTGFGSSPRQAYFQVAILPSIAQIGSVLELVKNIEAQAQDRFTLVEERASFNSLTTDLRNDPYASNTNGAVRK